MLLTNGPSSFKFFTLATLISLVVVISFNFYIYSLGADRRFFDPFSDSSIRCSPSPVLENALDPAISVQPSPTATVTLAYSILVPASPVTVLVTVTSTSTPIPTNSPQLNSQTIIPSKIWYKLGPKGLSKDTKKWTTSCLSKNPTYRHEFLTDTTGDNYVQTHYSHRPDIISTYLALPIPILKADLLRYLILYAEGGIWSDLDVSCEKVPIDQWIPEGYKEQTSVVVGLEFDWAWEDDNFLHSQFASWMIMAKPNSPHMLQVIEDILSFLKDKASEHNVEIKDLTTEIVGEVVDATGPKRMTRSIVKSLEATMARTIDDRDISGLKEPKLIGDVLILPGNSFAATQSNYPKDQGEALVTHHYAGTWKNEHGGEMS